MGDRGRDLKISILSDAAKFDLDKPADQLDNLADSATDAGRALDRVDSKSAARSLDQLGDEATQTARRVDTAFDTIARASRSSSAKLGDDADHNRRKMREVADEAHQTARESAASFTGSFDDVGDAIQETLANAFAGLGPAGAAAGVAAAAGLGIIINQLQAAADEANATAEQIIELADAMHDAGGALRGEQLAAQLRSWANTIKDTKSWFEVWQTSAVSNFDLVKRAAAGTGVELRTMFKAMSGSDAAAAEQALAAIARKIDDVNASETIGQAHKWDAIHTLESYRDEITKNIAVWDQAAARERLLADLTGATSTAVADYTTAARDARDANEALYADTSTVDTWATAHSKAVDLAKVSVRDWIRALEEQTKAQEAWATNLKTLARRGVEQGVLAELERLGPEGAPLIARLTQATDDELLKAQDLMRRRGQGMGDQLAAGVTAAAPAVSLATRRAVEQAAAEAAAMAAKSPITFIADVDLRRVYQKLAQARADAKYAAMERVTP